MSLKMFAEEALADFSTTAAISPSSPQLAAAMLEHLPLASASVVVEMGAGTGVITRALLNELPQQATLLVFEINQRFFDYLKAHFSDPRVVFIHASVEHLDLELRQRGFSQVDAVASSLGLGLMSEHERQVIFDRLLPFVHDRTVFTQYQYIHALQCKNGRLRRLDLRPLLGQYFASVQSKLIWRNLPPAFVFSCRLTAQAGELNAQKNKRHRRTLPH
jgi:phosphatidylethanolamine/phosphatidyl-N-methylethanolamine N-methyltransferase